MEAGISVERPIERIETLNAPAAIGPYSQALVAGGLVFVSGQIPLDPATGEIVAGGIEAQTRRVLQNLAAILEAAGSSIRRAVRTTVYLSSMADYAVMNQVYAEFFEAPYPVRTTIQAAALPRDVLVEIDMIALAGR